MANPKSLSQRASEMSRSCCVMLCFGVGVNLRPKPRSELAEGGSVPLVVRLWKARFVTWVKYFVVCVWARMCCELRWSDNDGLVENLKLLRMCPVTEAVMFTSSFWVVRVSVSICFCTFCWVVFFRFLEWRWFVLCVCVLREGRGRWRMGWEVGW